MSRTRQGLERILGRPLTDEEEAAVAQHRETMRAHGDAVMLSAAIAEARLHGYDPDQGPDTPEVGATTTTSRASADAVFIAPNAP